MLLPPSVAEIFVRLGCCVLRFKFVHYKGRPVSETNSDLWLEEKLFTEFIRTRRHPFLGKVIDEHKRDNCPQFMFMSGAN